MASPVVFTAGPASDPTFVLNRDEKNREDDRRVIEAMWRRYEPYCPDKNFLAEVRRSFSARMWEMSLACSFLDNGHTLRKPSAHGPDICIQSPQGNIWVEAIAVKQGDGPDRVPDPVYDQAEWFSDEAHILRYTAAVAEKRKKLAGYLEAGIVSPGDRLVIAVNAGALPNSDMDGRVPAFIKSVLPFGAQFFRVEIGTGRMMGIGHHRRESVEKHNEVKVSTAAFTQPEYAVISALIFSPNHIFHRPRRQGDDLSLLHNPHAKVPLSRHAFRFGQEYWIDGGNLRHKDHRELG